MKLKAIITTVFFIGALFTGSALAGERGAAADDPAQQGAQTPGVYGQEQQVGEGQAGVFGQDQDEIAGMHKADELMDQAVMSQEGEEIGTIENLVISENGQVDFIILSRNGDMVPVPWEAANLQKGEDDQLTADITQQQLEGAPTFEDYAEIASQEYEQQVHSYFGTESPIEGYSPQMDQQSPGTTN